MKNCNTLLVNFDIERSFLLNLNVLLMSSTPIRMYTYATCIATYSDELYLKSDPTSKLSYMSMEILVSDLYGNRMDNKITMEFSINMWDVDNEPYTIPLYITYWDGDMIVSNKVHFFKEDLTGYDSYRVIDFKGIKY